MYVASMVLDKAYANRDNSLFFLNLVASVSSTCSILVF